MRRSAIVLSLVLSCGGATLSSAKSDFAKGRYPQARDELALLEEPSKAWEPKKRIEYALYRGLVHLALGDRAAAEPWIAQAIELDRANPGALSEDDRTRLGLAKESVSAAAP
jgi:hypothetical protein